MSDPNTKHAFAGDATIDHQTNQVYIDGVRIPWWLSTNGPTVERYGDDSPIHVVTLPLLLDGVITIVGDDGSKDVIDPELGNVREWAKAYVRNELANRFPWLDCPA